MVEGEEEGGRELEGSVERRNGLIVLLIDIVLVQVVKCVLYLSSLFRELRSCP